MSPLSVIPTASSCKRRTTILNSGRGSHRAWRPSKSPQDVGLHQASTHLSLRHYPEPPDELELDSEAPWCLNELQTLKQGVAPQVQTHLHCSTEQSGPGRTLPLRAIAFGSAKSQGLRPYMEDRHCIVGSLSIDNLPIGSSSSGIVVVPSPSGHFHQSFAAVFDGHCGSFAADVAAGRMHQLLAASPALLLAQEVLPPPAVAKAEEPLVRAALKHAFMQVEDEILSMDRQQEPPHSSGTTALVMLHRDGRLYTAHTGDSRAVLCRGSQAVRLTEDHKPNQPGERARIEKQGGKVEWMRGWRVMSNGHTGGPLRGLNLSRCLGDLPFKEPVQLVVAEPDIRRVDLQARDAFVILASDGLWGALGEQDAVDLVLQVLSEFELSPDDEAACEAAAHAAAQRLVSRALDNGSTDNITAVVMVLNWDK